MWNPATGKMERVLYIDFDKSRLIISAVSDTDYWMVEATGNNAVDVLNIGGEDLKHRQPSTDDNPQTSEPITNLNLNIKRFKSIST